MGSRTTEKPPHLNIKLKYDAEKGIEIFLESVETYADMQNISDKTMWIKMALAVLQTTEYGTRVIDYIGRIKAPMILTVENGWRRVWNRVHWDDNTAPRYIERNMITQEERPIQEG